MNRSISTKDLLLFILNHDYGFGTVQRFQDFGSLFKRESKRIVMVDNPF